MKWLIWPLIILAAIALILFLVYYPESLSLDFWLNDALAIVKIISAAVSIIAGILLLFVFILAFITRSKPEEELTAEKKKTIVQPIFIRERWENVLKRIKDKEYNLAVIEADSILNETLKNLGYNEETLAEKLKNFSVADLSTIDEIWNIHKIRNQIVHDGYKTNEEEAIKGVKIYKKTLLELGVI